MSMVTGGGLLCTICYPCAMYMLKSEGFHHQCVFLILGFLYGVLSFISKNCFKSEFHHNLLEQFCNLSDI
jgi:hypothetical protein